MSSKAAAGHPAARGSSDDVGDETNLVSSPTNAHPTINTAARKHAKGLSLNLPILLPSTPQMLQSHSPTANSTYQSPIHSSRSSPRIRTSPFRPHDYHTDTGDPSKARSSSDFLTLLAAQERKVLELREELQKAEADLLGLKKQWATYEANKKREEVKHVKKLHALPLDDVPSPSRDSTAAGEEVDDERRRKRALAAKSTTVNTAAVNGDSTTGLSEVKRKGSKRVFEGGRHTRALSLLSPTSTRPGHGEVRKSSDERVRTKQTDDSNGTEDDSVFSPQSLSRISTLDGLISADPLQLGFGKTYKELAAHRRSLPPVAADLLVKQGKQVYDGMREGLWTFWEDIRQATVGEEGINGTVQQQRPARPASSTNRRPPKNETGSGLGLGLQKSIPTRLSTEERDSRRERGLTSKESSFWREFGLDTPQRQSTNSSDLTSAAPPSDLSSDVEARGHVQQKSSTDSTNPPSLLPDLNDHDHDVETDDAWEAWDSPVTTRIVSEPEREERNFDTTSTSVAVDKIGKLTAGGGGDHGHDHDGLPWPEIQKLSTTIANTPSKLTRTVSDLMREWEGGPDGGNRQLGDDERMSKENGLVGGGDRDHDFLDSPHM